MKLNLSTNVVLVVAQQVRILPPPLGANGINNLKHGIATLR